MRLFVDTSAWVSLFTDETRRSGHARETLAAHKGRARFITSDYVLDETVTRIRTRRGHGPAMAAGAAVLNEDLAMLRRVDASDLHNAWRLFRKYSDKKLSFTDCTILAQMERLGIDTLFTFDDGFHGLGVQVVP